MARERAKSCLTDGSPSLAETFPKLVFTKNVVCLPLAGA
jgi:hypothetical protein